jgi:hypothetical protein
MSHFWDIDGFIKVHEGFASYIEWKDKNYLLPDEYRISSDKKYVIMYTSNGAIAIHKILSQASTTDYEVISDTTPGTSSYMVLEDSSGMFTKYKVTQTLMSYNIMPRGCKPVVASLSAYTNGLNLFCRDTGNKIIKYGATPSLANYGLTTVTTDWSKVFTTDSASGTFSTEEGTLRSDGNAYLYPGSKMYDLTKAYVLEYTSSGDMTISTASGKVYWRANVSAAMPKYAVMQGDGNFVLYANKDAQGTKHPYWATNTVSYSKSFKLQFESDGNLVLYNADGKKMWQSGGVSNIVQEFPPSSVVPGTLNITLQNITYRFSNSGGNGINAAWLFDKTKDTHTYFDGLGGYSTSTGHYNGTANSGISGAKGAWFQMSVSKPIIVTGYILSQKLQFFNKWVLAASNDESNWVLLDSKDFATWNDGENTVTYKFHNMTSYVHFRFVIIRSQNAHAPCISEFTFLGRDV